MFGWLVASGLRLEGSGQEVIGEWCVMGDLWRVVGAGGCFV